MSTMYCTFCNRKASVTKYKRYLCEACHMAFVAGRQYAVNFIKDEVIKLFKGETE